MLGRVKRDVSALAALDDDLRRQMYLEIRQRRRPVSREEVAAAVLWLAASALFSFYAANFGNFNETYGSLGAAIGFMVWMWMSATIVLFGAELNSEIERQTASGRARLRTVPVVSKEH